MKTAISALILGFVVSTWLTPLFRDWGMRIRLIDDPREGRRVHEQPISRIGGIPIALGFLAPILGLAIYENEISAAIYADSRSVVSLFVGMACILAIGLADDLFNPPAKWRLLAIVGVATFTWLGGNQIELLEVPRVGVFELGVLSAPVTILWIVGVIVAFNFIDGLDGLAAGIALIASFTMFIMALITNNVLWMTWTGAMAGSLVGFLVFNFHPASIFMGDSGSNFLGYMMAVIAIGTSQKESTGIALLIPMFVLGLPILDAALTMLRRALLREGMFLSERGHLHHRLLDIGISHRDVVLTLWGVTLLLCLGGLTFLTDVDRLQIFFGVAISGAVFGLMFFTGYIRPYDLRTMWDRGLANLARDKALAELSTDLAESVDSQTTAEGLGAVLEKLTTDGGITGVLLTSPNQADRVFGVYEHDAKGVRTEISIPGAEEKNLTFLWKGRLSGPTKNEVKSLKEILAKLD